MATLRAAWSGSVGGVSGFWRPDPAPPIIIGAFGPKMVDLAGRVADGVNLGGGPGLARAVEAARAARRSAGRDPASFVVTVSSPLSASALERLSEHGVDRAVALVRPPFATAVRRLGAARR